MAISLLNAVWDYNVTGNTRSVLQVLCDHANDEGFCWPSVRSIAWKVGVSEQTVYNIMAKLKEIGVISVVEPGGGRGKTNAYLIDLTQLQEKPQISQNHQPQSLPFPPPEKPSKPSNLNPQNPQISDPPRGDNRGVLEPSLNEPSVNPSDGEHDDPPPRKGGARIYEVAKWYADRVGGYVPGNKSREWVYAKQLAETGVTNDELESLYLWLWRTDWVKSISLQLMAMQYNNWRSTMAPPPQPTPEDFWAEYRRTNPRI